METLLHDWGLNLCNYRGQGCDNGLNMKGHKQWVQAGILVKEPTAFVVPVPCGTHGLNLVLCNMVKSCRLAVLWFGASHSIYCIFVSSTKHWDLLKNICSCQNEQCKKPSFDLESQHQVTVNTYKTFETDLFLRVLDQTILKILNEIVSKNYFEK